MQKIITLLLMMMGFVPLPVFSQINTDTASSGDPHAGLMNDVLKGRVLDKDTKVPLRYANIYVLHKNTGTVSNEKGEFLLNIAGLEKGDTVRFRYIGYQPVWLTVGQLDTLRMVYMKEKIFNLSETVVYGKEPDPVAIVKNVLKNKEANYRQSPEVMKIFRRSSDVSDIQKLVMNYKKSSIPQLDREMMRKAEKKIPRHSVSFVDFLGETYSTGKEDDTLKIKPIRTVALKDKNFSGMDQLTSLFDSIFRDTGEKEYWKMKSGIFGGKLDIGESDTIPSADSLSRIRWNTDFFGRQAGNDLKFARMDNKKEWDFLYNTGRYKYTLAGGTRVNGEEVYVIDFVPHNSGNYRGRLYIAAGSYALIRADFDYAPGKTGTDIHLLGVGYTENAFSGSIYFVKKGNRYVLKYFLKKEGVDVIFNRNLALIKKRKRFLFDKTLEVLKMGVQIEVEAKTSVEILVLDQKEITLAQYTGFKPQEYMPVVYVNQFNPDLWKGFSIIEPTEQMRKYKRQTINSRNQ